jgi:hypothetical protein
VPDVIGGQKAYTGKKSQKPSEKILLILKTKKKGIFLSHHAHFNAAIPW